jgi:hypothetical protein
MYRSSGVFADHTLVMEDYLLLSRVSVDQFESVLI